MTTTELIELLKKNERGGATGRPREVMFEVDDRIIDTDGIEVTGSGDGLISELYLSLPSAQQGQKKGEWIRDKKTEKEEQLMFHKVWTCSECGEQQCRPKPSNFCPNCGADMRGEL